MKYVPFVLVLPVAVITGALRQIRMLQRPSPKKMSPSGTADWSFLFRRGAGFHAGRLKDQLANYEHIRAISLPIMFPRVIFNPIPAGMQFEKKHRAFHAASLGKWKYPIGRGAGVLFGEPACKAPEFETHHLDQLTASTSID